MKPKGAAEATIDSVTGAIGLLWDWLSAEEPQSAVGLLDGSSIREREPEREPNVIETEGEAWPDE